MAAPAVIRRKRFCNQNFVYYFILFYFFICVCVCEILFCWLFVLRVFVLCFLFATLIWWESVCEKGRESAQIFEENILIKVQKKKKKYGINGAQIKRRSSFQCFFRSSHVLWLIHIIRIHYLTMALELDPEYTHSFWTGFSLYMHDFESWN